MSVTDSVRVEILPSESKPEIVLLNNVPGEWLMLHQLLRSVLVQTDPQLSLHEVVNHAEWEVAGCLERHCCRLRQVQDER